MFAAAPETIVGAALYACGVCCVGWAWLARVNVYADVQDPAPRLFATAGFCLLAAVSMSLVLVA